MAQHFMSDETLRELALLSGSHETMPRGLQACDTGLLIAGRPLVGLSGTRADVADPAAPVSKQLAVCLEVLRAPLDLVEETYGAGAIAAAQQRLTRLLIGHPVLLHPQLRIHVSLGEAVGENGVCSLAHAIALSRHARFPLERDGLSTEELAAFGNHPLVRVSLASKPPGDERGVLRAAERSTPLRAAALHRSDCAGLIASLWQLHQLLDAEHEAADGCGEHLLMRSLESDLDVNVPVVSGWSFLSALSLCGVAYTAKQRYCRSLPCPEFVALVAHDEPGARKAMQDALGSLARAAIFHRGATTSAARVRESMHRIAHGLVTARLQPGLPAAALWLRSLLEAGFSRCGFEPAVAYLRGLEELGAGDLPAFLASPAMHWACRQPEAGPWLDAARLHETEMGMRAVIERAGQAETQLGREPVAVAAGGLGTSPGARRRRAQI